MTLQDKISQLDSLDRMEMELEIEKKLEKKSEEEFKQQLKNCTKNNEVNVDALIALLDKRYVKKLN